MPVNPLALRRLKQEDRHEFKASLGYTVNSRQAWATQRDPVKRKKENKDEEDKEEEEEKRKKE